MALHFILDGYNIIKSERSGRLSGGTLQAQRERLIALIGERRPQGSARNSVTVVFDGKSENPYVYDSFNTYHVGDIEIIFSEGTKADDIIERVTLESENPANVVVVTDDKGIRRLLGSSGARFLSVAEFTGRLFRPSGGTDEREASPEDNDEEFRKRWL